MAGDDGVIGLVGLLMTLLILGALVAISLTVFDSAVDWTQPDQSPASFGKTERVLEFVRWPFGRCIMQ